MWEEGLVEVLGRALAPDATEWEAAARQEEAAARQELARLLGPAPEWDTELAAAWRAAAGGSPDGVRNLATVLVRRAAGDGRLAGALREWLDARPAPSALEGGGSHTNTIGGAARLHGPTVQARDVHGGIHVHQAPATAPPRLPTPRQLPPVGARLAGREEDLRALDALRAAHPPTAPQLVVVSGPPGVGKTVLASWWLHKLADDFPDGQLYADLGGHSPTGPVRPADVLDRFLRSMGMTAPPGDPAEQAALWRSVTADLRLAVLLDDAATAAQVRPLLPGTPGGLTVVTSRQRLTGLVVDGAAVHHLRALEPDAALELLRSGGGDRVVRDPDTARRVVRLCAFLPLAVSLAAAQLAARPRQPLSALAGALDRELGPLEALRVEGDAAVRTALDESYRALPDGAARVYRRLGLLPVTHYDTPMAAAVCALSPEDTEEVLGLLVETNLLEDAGADRVRFHDLVRLHAAQRARAEEGGEARREVARRFVDWCLHTATAAEAILSPAHRTLARHYEYPPADPPDFGDGTAALAWLDVHRNSLMAAVRLAGESGWDAAVWQLADAMWPLFLRLRPSELWVEAHTLGLAAARRDGDREAVGRMLTSGGNGLRNAGRIEEAADWYGQALRHAEEEGDVRGQAQALNGLGNARLRTGRLDEAEEYFRRALVLRESIGYERGAALSRLCLGETALARGDHDRAAGYLSRAYDDLTAVDDAYDAARALALLGHTTACAGDPAGGEERLRRALTAFEATGSAHWRARTLELLGLTARRAGDEERARELLRRSLETYRPVSPVDARRLAGRLRTPDDAGAGTGPVEGG
ncbi:tetratricopeptide repeat protein [Streptomyces sp. TRM 70361]|uniref:ATP-binding protein n=1 Tax=Streptomyces sp. TRM 70361 TaxID=3116553 RepID=UPI002E7BB7E2|nr:tetratricopeptide repeat protein [Streptomyces sp. TRM 70361]MEE1938945.1 tetratricopeptide repeat protein [Streptomyces sp. TRM 70361]